MEGWPGRIRADDPLDVGVQFVEDRALDLVCPFDRRPITVADRLFDFGNWVAVIVRPLGVECDAIFGTGFLLDEAGDLEIVAVGFA